ncbi:protocadherin-8 [Sceloporus undulatus]|uniref:protocadherin-8 n=1 Tax=Sceloporus undulatus TaxID=8520 RepID=UPI001C4BCDC9|nr:protocadherin-8 [Sceloporus undulatus]
MERASPCPSRALLFFCWMLSSSSSALGKTIRYHTYEEEPPGTVIGTLADEMPSDSGERTFRLMKPSGNGSLVLVRERDGQLSLGPERLDREQLCGQAEGPCLLAFDVVSLGGSVASSYRLLHVEVEVRDVNDHAPRFPQSVLALEVSESAAPGTRLPLALAFDPDAGTNGIQSFAVSPNRHFGLEAQSRADGLKCAELVLLTELDRETEAAYRLELVAKDGGSPARSGTATVSVRVLDANDNAPSFPRGGSLLTVELPEDAAPGSLLLELEASDPDEGANGQLRYSWGSQVSVEARRLFALDPLSGRLTLRGAVDYELQRAYELDVQASDRGASPLAASCKVVVRLLDVNDNAPALAITALRPPTEKDNEEEEEEEEEEEALEGATVAYVSEAAPAESLVALVSASDSDAGANGQVRCSLLLSPDGSSGEPSAPFALHRAYDASYVVLTTGSLDRERRPEYNLTVVAEDLGSPPSRTLRRLTVRLSDENDNPPRFSRPRFEVALAENNPPGASLATLSAHDPDLGSNARLAYRLLPPPDGQILGAPLGTFLSVDAATGALYALRAFDRERLPFLDLTVRATDGGQPPLHADAPLRIRILDVNDNAPVVVQPPLRNGSLEVLVPGKAPRGSTVARIQAHDADEGANAELSFALLDDMDRKASEEEEEEALELFAVDERTGEIVLTGSLSGAPLGRVYRLLLRVADHGQPPMATSVPLRFVVAASWPPSVEREAGSKARGEFKELASSSSSSSSSSGVQWDTPLIVIAVLAGSCTLLLAAIITIATTCKRRRRRRKGKDAQEVEDTLNGPPRLDLEGSPGKGFPEAPSSPPFPSKAAPTSEDLTPAASDGGSSSSSAVPGLYDAQSRLRGANGAEPYTSNPSYSKEPVPPMAIWKGHSFNTISGREADKFSGKDSGKGDSDFNDSDSDISGDALKKDLITHMQNGLWACTAECKILGHSDRCWSPSCGRPNTHAAPHPKTQLSTFCKSTSLPRDSLRRDNFYQAQLPKTVGLQSVYEKVLHRDYDRTMTLLSPPHPGRLPDLQEISVPLYQAPSTRYLGPPPETSQKV